MNTKAMLYIGIILIALGTLLVHRSNRKASAKRIDELEGTISEKNKELSDKQESLGAAQNLAQQRLDENNLLLLENEGLQSENSIIIKENRDLSKSNITLSKSIEKISSYIKNDIDDKNETISLKDYTISYLSILENKQMEHLKPNINKEFLIRIEFYQLENKHKKASATATISGTLKAKRYPLDYDYGLAGNNTFHIYTETNEFQIHTAAIEVNNALEVFNKNEKLFFHVKPQTNKFKSGFPKSQIWLRDKYGRGFNSIKTKKDVPFSNGYFIIQ